MNKLEFNEAQWEVTRFLNIPVSTGILSNQTGGDLGNYDEYEIGDDDEGGETGGGF